MIEIYCSSCMDTKPKIEFSKWYERKCRDARLCNDCKSGRVDFNDILKSKRAMQKESISKLTPVQVGFSGSKYAKNKRETRQDISERLEAIRLAKEIEL